MKNWGLDKDELEIIQNIFSQHPPIEKIKIFGSRARGDFRRNSDIDFALYGKNLSRQDINQILAQFETSSLIYNVDIAHFEKIQNENFKKVIETEGKIFPKN